MPSNLDIYRSAAVLVRSHGRAAKAEAEARAKSLAGEGDAKGAGVWQSIAAAVVELQRQEPLAGTMPH